MPGKNLRTLDVRSREQWRNWLREHHNSDSGIWLVIQKCGAPEKSVSYDDLVEEALCFGWIDSIVKRLDDEHYVRKFTPRKADSKWSTINRRRYEDLKRRGLLAERGLQRAPTGRSGDAPRPYAPAIPSYIEEQLKANPGAGRFFDQLAPSYRRAYIGWIDSAKREETEERRLRAAITALAAGKKLGLK